MKNKTRFFCIRNFLVLLVVITWGSVQLHSFARAQTEGDAAGTASASQETQSSGEQDAGQAASPPVENSDSDSAKTRAEEEKPTESSGRDYTDPDSALSPAQRAYLLPSMQNLSKLYWELGMFDIDKDDVAVDNYIMINECQIYRDYFTDDFEWKNVREATRAYLRKNMKAFPRRFEFIQPIELGRYNEDTQTFEVLTELVTKGSRVLYSDFNSRNDKVCDKRGVVEAYPRNVIVSLSRPIHYPQVPVNADFARDYVARAKIRNEEDFRDAPGGFSVSKFKDYQRLAFIVVKVRMIKFIEMRNARDGVFPVVFAALEGVEIYEDPLKKRLLYSSLSRTKGEQ